MKIIFSDTVGIDDKYFPKPAQKFIPEWYKQMPSYLTGKRELNEDAETNGTAKKCIPIFDAMTAGYLIFSPADVMVTQKDGFPYYQWASHDLIKFHPVDQAPNHPNRNNHPISYPKWMNPWGIKTPKGYSCLFTAPKHRDNPFTILDGIVDTDSYLAPVNFPFVLNDVKFKGLIPAGTAIAQVIPFKRDSFEMEISVNQSDRLKSINKLRSVFFDSYKTQFWTKKEYK